MALSHQQSRSIRTQIEKRGLAIAQSIAAASTADLLTYNYIALDQYANQAARNPDILRVIVHDKEGRIAAYSGKPELQNQILDDEISRKALRTTTPLIQESVSASDTRSVLDVSVPVFLTASDERWGTIRVGMSLAPVYRQIRQIQKIIFAIGSAALVIGILVSMWAARRITHPLANLVQASMEAAHGNLPQNVHTRTGDEVEILSSNFDLMIREIRSHRDLLESQLAEIKRLQNYLEKLLTTMNDGLMSVSLEGRLAAINPAALSILGIRDADPKPGEFISGFIPEGTDLYAYIQHRLKTPEGRGQHEIRFPGKEQIRVLLVGSSVLQDDRDHPEEIIFNIHDITERKELEARVRQAQRLAGLGTLAAGMAHEIRNPLSAIKTFVQLLPKKMEKPGFLEKFNRTVPREIDRLNNLVEDLLELARTPHYRFQSTDIRSLLLEIFDFVEEELAKDRIRSRWELPPDLPAVSADASQLTKAFQNLIRNAVQAMPGGGRLTVTARYEKGEQGPFAAPENPPRRLCIAFSDTGPGMSTDVLKNIFNPFFSTKDKGTGLGLAITHKVVMEHGGFIQATSTPGEGSRFTVVLPVS
ncbi:MAG: HAMP domain-containing protein [Desulfobacteraceae bacterium]|nr:HAMP domain-containing protein [Desulfobacteraceae bacterium]